jgi:hypothetical protein
VEPIPKRIEYSCPTQPSAASHNTKLSGKLAAGLGSKCCGTRKIGIVFRPGGTNCRLGPENSLLQTSVSKHIFQYIVRIFPYIVLRLSCSRANQLRDCERSTQLSLTKRSDSPQFTRLHTLAGDHANVLAPCNRGSRKCPDPVGALDRNPQAFFRPGMRTGRTAAQR